ncbi:SpoIID/LytB domain-containing protein [Gorillibacterium massiliense]|uniref:SpoIID/LytB domain-containing protein n=1 Tax=Gorillibacterium massiliense TaxID=1280390 RepID=UPI00138E49C4|nr:SpoIID/LytB domain-containing protein [Gorillibacterium massiliense]
MKNKRKLAVWSLLTAGLLQLPIGFSSVSQIAHAETSVPANIRVAFYMLNKSLKTIPSVAFNSGGAIQVGNKTAAGGVRPWFSATGETRFGLNQTRIQWPIATDYNQAKALYQQLTDAKQSPVLFVFSLKGKPAYQIFSGDYASSTEGAQGQAALLKSPIFATYTDKTVLTGNFFAEVASYATEQEAVTRQGILAQAGVATELVVQDNVSANNPAGNAIYKLWFGGSASQAELDSLKAQASALSPGLSFAVANTDAPYLIRKTDASLTASGGTAFYLLNPADAAGQKVWITTDTGKLTVKEKQLSYRGAFELSSFSGKLAVVNELPFEDYLYAVVYSEIGPNVPAEAIKAQAVIARTYAMAAGNKYGIANVSDSTLDQVYFGKEAQQSTDGVDATKGQLVYYGNDLAQTFFYANAGGMTSDGAEVWGSSLPYLTSVTSPDSAPSVGKLTWYRVITDNGISGYIRSDLLRDTGVKSKANLPYYETTEDGANLRPSPSTEQATIAQLNTGTRVAVIGQAIESTKYTWKWLSSAQELVPSLNKYLPTAVSGVKTIEVLSRGPSGRVTGLKLDGVPFTMPYPDNFRTMLGSLRSTKFDIEETGRYTILGANGASSEYPVTTGVPYVLTGTGNKTQPASEMLVLNGTGAVRPVSVDQKFLFSGSGYGHGLGMSQDGAAQMARDGRSYMDILSYYYPGTTIK